MKKRLITGVVYVIVMLGILAMKLFIPVTSDGLDLGGLGVDVLFLLISVIGAYEFLRAVGEVSPAQKWVTIVTCALIIPTFVTCRMVTIKIGREPIPGVAAFIGLLAVTSLGAMAVASLTVFDHERSTLKSTAYAELCILYCGALPCVGANLNHMMVNSGAAIILLFFICPAVDTFAFFIGKIFGKALPYKLAPNVSPNKTIVGSVGGVIGGIFAGVLTWVLCEYTGFVGFETGGKISTVAVLILISLPTAVLAQLGDLFESAIKRNCGVKDMGKCLPGHGGVLDRFDSTLFAGVSIAVCFMLV